MISVQEVTIVHVMYSKLTFIFFLLLYLIFQENII